MRTMSKLFTALILSTSAFSMCPNISYASCVTALEQRFENLEKRVRLLEMDELVTGPISVSKVHLNNDKHFTIVSPGEKFDCSFHYKLDSSDQNFLEKNHLIIGIQNVAAETCATHLYNVWDSSGTAKFELVAPLVEGDYEVRIAYRPGETCEEALSSWNVIGDVPNSDATIGIIKVRSVAP